MTFLKAMLLAALGAAGIITSHTSNAMTLDEVLKHSVETNPELLAKEAERKVVDSNRRAAYAGYLPTLDASAGYGRDSNNNLTTRAISQSTGSDSLTLTRRESNVSLNQALFDGFAVMHGVEANEARVNSASKDVYATLENVLLRTIEVYLDVIRYTAVVGYAKENLSNHQSIFQQIQLRAQSGISKRADVDQASGRLALARTNLLDAQANLRDARANFIRVIGLEPADMLTRPEILQEELPGTEEASIALALKNSQALQKAQMDVLAFRADKRQSTSSYYPKLNLTVSGSNNRNLDGSKSDSNSFSVMLRMNYNIFRGGADKAREQSANWNVEKAKEDYNSAYRAVEQSMRIAWNAYASAHAQLGFRKEHAEAIQRTRDAYKEQYVIGQRTLLDLLDSENELYSSKSAYIAAQITELLGRYRVMQGINRLSKHFNIALPDTARYKPGSWVDGF